MPEKPTDGASLSWGAVQEDERCPTCGEAKPDTISPVGDYGGGPYEADCGDEWHARFYADPVVGKYLTDLTARYEAAQEQVEQLESRLRVLREQRRIMADRRKELREQVERLRAERDEAREIAENADVANVAAGERRLAAESERDRLREALGHAGEFVAVMVAGGLDTTDEEQRHALAVIERDVLNPIQRALGHNESTSLRSALSPPSAEEEG